MLSKWQELAINKKYDSAINEAKSLRGELLVSDAKAKEFEQHAHQAESNFCQMVLNHEKEVQELRKNRGFFVTQEKVQEQSRLLDELSDEKSNVEMDLMKARSQLREEVTKNKEAETKADTA